VILSGQQVGSTVGIRAAAGHGREGESVGRAGGSRVMGEDRTGMALFRADLEWLTERTYRICMASHVISLRAKNYQVPGL